MLRKAVRVVCMKLRKPPDILLTHPKIIPMRRSNFFNDSKKEFTCGRTAITGLIAFSFWGFQEVEHEDTELEKTIKRGILLINKGEMSKAEEMFHLALKIAQDTQHTQGITYVYAMLANLAYDVGNWLKAEKLFKDLMRRLVADGVDLVDNKIISISSKLSRIYWATGRKEQAELGYKFCIDNFEEKIRKGEDQSEDTLLMLSKSLDDYGHFLLEENRIPESLRNLKKSYDAFVRAKGRDFEQAVVILSDIGTACMLCGQYDDAQGYFEEAVATASRLPEDFESLGRIYTGLGQVYLLKNKLTEAERACVIGRRLADKHNDRDTAAEADEMLKEIRTYARQAKLKNPV